MREGATTPRGQPRLARRSIQLGLVATLVRLLPASNAVKYNHHGGSIRLDCHATAEHRVAIVVADTGPGIPADKLERLFMPFDRLGAEQPDVQGTGLGLALSKGLVEAMGGTLTAGRRRPHRPPLTRARSTRARSRPGRGTGPTAPRAARPAPR
jgi:signal transduction histidine kinase